MKKQLLMLSVLALAFTLLAGCERSESSKNTPSETNAVGEQPVPGSAGTNNPATPPGGGGITTNAPAGANK